MQTPPVPRYLVPPRFKYSPQEYGHTLVKFKKKKIIIFQLNIFEWKVYRGNSGPVFDNEKENWRI
jgi:hypothetical protein